MEAIRPLRVLIPDQKNIRKPLRSKRKRAGAHAPAHRTVPASAAWPIDPGTALAASVSRPNKRCAAPSRTPFPSAAELECALSFHGHNLNRSWTGDGGVANDTAADSASRPDGSRADGHNRLVPHKASPHSHPHATGSAVVSMTADAGCNAVGGQLKEAAGRCEGRHRCCNRGCCKACDEPLADGEVDSSAARADR